jgi:hypothetical protein
MWLRLASVLWKLVGLVAWAEALIKRHEESEKAKQDADAPVTNGEEIDDFGRW